MKKDCSNILVYKRERIRMCRSLDPCDDCDLDEDTCREIDDITPEHIEIVQKWSDEHPVKTRQSEFLKSFPKAKLLPEGCIDICPQRVETSFLCGDKVCSECQQEFWLQEVE